MKKALFNPVRPEHSQLDIIPFSLSQKLEPNCKNLDNETLQVLKDSEYLERLEMLWEDSAERLLQS